MCSVCVSLCNRHFSYIKIIIVVVVTIIDDDKYRAENYCTSTTHNLSQRFGIGSNIDAKIDK